MTSIQEIKLMNESMILYLRKLGKDSKRNEIISKILEDETCFFKIDKKNAYIILEDIGIAKDKVDSMYLNLISYDNYYELKNLGKIKEDDKNIIIKYKDYEHKDLFKNRKEENMVKEHHDNELIEYKETFIKKIIDKIKKLFK